MAGEQIRIPVTEAEDADGLAASGAKGRGSTEP
jgi:hypothetical protein